MRTGRLEKKKKSLNPVRNRNPDLPTCSPIEQSPYWEVTGYSRKCPPLWNQLISCCLQKTSHWTLSSVPVSILAQLQPQFNVTGSNKRYAVCWQNRTSQQFIPPKTPAMYNSRFSSWFSGVGDPLLSLEEKRVWRKMGGRNYSGWMGRLVIKNRTRRFVTKHRSYSERQLTADKKCNVLNHVESRHLSPWFENGTDMVA